jgi:hypothetical protein
VKNSPPVEASGAPLMAEVQQAAQKQRRFA